jgi:hypothetical protein
MVLWNHIHGLPRELLSAQPYHEHPLAGESRHANFGAGSSARPAAETNCVNLAVGACPE